MPGLRSVLLYGHDNMLLFTRHLILERSGFQVFSTSDFEEAEIIASRHPIDLLVLCQTVNAQERSRALAMVQAFSPDAVALSLAEMLPTYGGEAVLHNSSSFVTAKSFLDSVEEVIRQDNPPPQKKARD